MFDKNIPIPRRAPKWDFSFAEIGDSMAFGTRYEANKFADTLRKYARANGKAWGAVQAQQAMSWRVWIVEGKARKDAMVRVPVEQVAMQPLAVNFAVRPEIVASNVAPSTETDDDLMLSHDPRRGGLVTFGKQPEAKPIDEVDEVLPSGRRKRRREAK
jgi:hypothetical protein